MTTPRWMSALSPHRPPVPGTAHWTAGIVVSVVALSAAVYGVAAGSLPDRVDHDAQLDSVIVSLGAPAQRLEPPPPLPPDMPPPEPVEPQAPTERADDAPPPEAPPQKRALPQASANTGQLSSGFGSGPPAPPPLPPPPPPPPPPPKRVELDQRFVDISSAAYLRRIDYPYEALRRNIQGNGLLLVEIDRQGTILSHELVQSTGSRLLDREIERVAREVRQLDPLPDYYPRQTAKLFIPFSFVLGPG